MWGSFFLACIVCALVLYLPGILFFRFARVNAFSSIALSPIYSLFCYGCVGMAFQFLGVSCSWQFLVGTAFCLSFLGLIFRLVSNHCSLKIDQNNKIPFWIIAAYLIIGIAITLNMFVAPLDGPESFQQTFDNPNHLTIIQSIVSSGIFSPLFPNFYPDITGGPLAGGSSFYPSMWHIIAAFLVLSAGVSVPMAANATVAVFTGIVFPLSVCYMLNKLFSSKKVVALGAIFSLCFLMFPWVFYWAGPLYPNAASFCVAPLVAGLFIGLLQKGSLKARLIKLFGFFCGCLVLLFLHPNTIFMLVVFFAPLCVSKVFHVFKHRGRRVAYTAALACIIGVLLFWTVAYNLPMLQGTVTYSWDSFASLPQALVNIILYSFRYEGIQPLLSFIVLIGIFYLIKKKQHRWLVVSYVIFCVFYFVTATTEGPIKSYLTGFWYTDPNRIAACIAFCGIPLACVGAERTLCFLTQKISTYFSISKSKNAVLSIVLSLGFLVANFYPSFTVYGVGTYSSPFTTYKQALSNLNNGTVHYSYSPEEQEFVEDCLKILPEGSLVANFPYDGSSMAYGVNGMSTVFRAYYDLTYQGYPELRKELNDVETSAEVRTFLSEMGIEYLILLDYAEGPNEGTLAFCEDPGRETQWSGMLAIRDDTPGFEVVLSRDDMRLYKINY